MACINNPSSIRSQKKYFTFTFSRRKTLALFCSFVYKLYPFSYLKDLTRFNVARYLVLHRTLLCENNKLLQQSLAPTKMKWSHLMKRNTPFGFCYFCTFTFYSQFEFIKSNLKSLHNHWKLKMWFSWYCSHSWRRRCRCCRRRRCWCCYYARSGGKIVII